MSQPKTKANKYENDEAWNKFLTPLNQHLTTLEESTDEDTIDQVLITKSQIRRGTRTAESRQNIVNQLKIDFADCNFDGWTQKRATDAEDKILDSIAKRNWNADIAFFKKADDKPTYRKDKVNFDFTDAEHYATHQKSNRRKALNKDWRDGSLDLDNTEEYLAHVPNYEVKVVASDDS